MEWKKFDDTYEVSEYGDVRSLGRHKKEKKLLKLRDTKKGYKQVFFWLGKMKGFQVHRLVYELFVGKLTLDYDVHHKDENKQNNHYTNLELIQHGTHTSIHKKGSKWLNHKEKIKKEKRDKTKNITYDMKAYQKAYQKNYREMRLKRNM